MKRLTERFQQFKKMYNSEIVKVYKDTKELLQLYENKMKRYGVPLEDSQIAFNSSDDTQKPARAEAHSSKGQFESHPKVIGKSGDRAGSIVLKRKQRAQSAESSTSSYGGEAKKKAAAAANLKKRDAI